jgi:hypothetical protein
MIRHGPHRVLRGLRRWGLVVLATEAPRPGSGGVPFPRYKLVTYGCDDSEALRALQVVAGALVARTLQIDPEEAIPDA